MENIASQTCLSLKWEGQTASPDSGLVDSSSTEQVAEVTKGTQESSAPELLAAPVWHTHWGGHFIVAHLGQLLMAISNHRDHTAFLFWARLRVPRRDEVFDLNRAFEPKKRSIGRPFVPGA